MVDIPLQLYTQAVGEAGQQTSASCQYDVTKKDLTEVWIARAKRGRNQSRDCLGEIWVRSLQRTQAVLSLA